MTVEIKILNIFMNTILKLGSEQYKNWRV